MPKRIRSFTVEFKRDVIDGHAENGRSIHKTAKEYKIDRKCVRNWLNQEDILRQNGTGS